MKCKINLSKDLIQKYNNHLMANQQINDNIKNLFCFFWYKIIFIKSFLIKLSSILDIKIEKIRHH